MLRYLYDPANAITSVGILLSGLALYAVISGRLELAVAIALWSMLADQLDGVVAKRTKNRSAEVAKIGKSLDGFGDIIYGAVIPAAVIMALSGGQLFSALVGVFLIFVGALRLSYFNSFGLSAGHFTGIPLSYDVPLLAVFFIAKPYAQEGMFLPVLTLSFLLLGCLHVSSIKVPAPGRAMYLFLTAFSATASAMLTSQALVSA